MSVYYQVAMKNSIRPDPASRREEILLAARRLFVEHGIPGTSMRILAREIGVTEGALYRHFPSKEDIVHELFESEASGFHDWLKSSLDRSRAAAVKGSKADPWADLESLVRSFIDYGRREPESFRVIMVLHQAPGVTQKPLSRLPRHLFDEVLGRLAASRGRSVDRGALVVMIAGLLSRLVQAEHDGQLSLGKDAVTPLAIKAVRGMLEAVLDLDSS